MPKQSDRMIWLDCLRLLAGVSMVGLHASSDANGLPFPDFPAEERVFPVLFRSVIYIARTELFIIISLFLLCMAVDARPRSYAEMVRQQFRRLMVPFAFWVVVFAFYNLIKAQQFGYVDAIRTDLGSPVVWLGYFVLGDVKYHMHFLPTLFPLVFMLPLYRLAVRHPELALVILLCLAAKREIDMFLWANLKEVAGFDYIVRFIKVLTYMGYGMVAGAFYGIYTRGFSRTEGTALIGLALTVGLMLYALKLAYSWRVINTGNWQWNFTPAFWADFLMPVVVFLGVMAACHRAWPLILSKLAPFSFGLYLAHPLFLDLAEIGSRNWDLSPSQLVIVKVTFAVLTTSLFLAGLARFKPLAWTIGMGPLPGILRLKLTSSKATQ